MQNTPQSPQAEGALHRAEIYRRHGRIPLPRRQAYTSKWIGTISLRMTSEAFGCPLRKTHHHHHHHEVNPRKVERPDAAARWRRNRRYGWGDTGTGFVTRGTTSALHGHLRNACSDQKRDGTRWRRRSSKHWNEDFRTTGHFVINQQINPVMSTTSLQWRFGSDFVFSASFFFGAE